MTSPSKARKTVEAHFVVTGEFLTATARSVLLSDRPANAWRLLTKGLVGTDVEKVVPSILEGNKKLVGDSDVGLTVKDERKRVRTAFKKQLHYLFAGRVRLDGAWFRPSAEVVDFGPGDVPEVDLRNVDLEDEEDSSGAREVLKKFLRGRVAFYAREGERLVEVVHARPDAKHVRLGARTFVIFEPCGEPPFWWDELPSSSEALAQFLAAGRELREESWSARFASRRVEVEVEYAEERAAETVQEEREELEEAREALKEVARRRRFQEIREEVLKQAAGDHFDLEFFGTHSVPRAPFECWALRRTSLAHLAPAWTPVSPSGVKLPLDDPYHTDWIVGAGFDPHNVDAYSGPFHEASMEAAHAVQERVGNFECHVVVGGPVVSGTVGKEVAVLRDLHPDHLDELLRSQGVVTQAGGQLAHLAQVATERNIPILRVPDAVARFPPGTKLVMFPADGSIVTSLLPRYVQDSLSTLVEEEEEEEVR